MSRKTDRNHRGLPARIRGLLRSRRAKRRPSALAPSFELLEPRTVLSAAASIVATPDFIDTAVPGIDQLYWEKGIYTDRTIDGASTDSIPFGLALPKDYDPAGATQYPLILYLHGKGAAENDTNKQLKQDTARFFARNAQLVPGENAFVLAPQTPDGEQWLDISLEPEDNGPYTQDASSFSEYMHLTEDLLDYLTYDCHDADLLANVGIVSADVDVTRIYVVGDSMGAFGVWDVVARNPDRFAAAIASSGSGPLNKTAEIQQTPLWAIHSSADTEVPNGLQGQVASDGNIYANGAGSLGTLEWIDPTFTGQASTATVYIDDWASDLDDPQITDTLIYTEFISTTETTFDHNKVSKKWTEFTSGVSDWLFAHTRSVTQPVLGDMNGDGAVDDADVNPFVLALTNYAQFISMYPEVNMDWAGDVNHDCSFDLGDLGAFPEPVATSGAAAAEEQATTDEQAAAPSATANATAPGTASLASVPAGNMVSSTSVRATQKGPLAARELAELLSAIEVDRRVDTRWFASTEGTHERGERQSNRAIHHSETTSDSSSLRGGNLTTHSAKRHELTKRQRFHTPRDVHLRFGQDVGQADAQWSDWNELHSADLPNQPTSRIHDLALLEYLEEIRRP